MGRSRVPNRQRQGAFTQRRAVSAESSRLQLHRRLWVGVVGLLGLVGVLVAAVSVGTSRADAGTWVEQGRGGSWTNVSADKLATMLTAKDFTLVNVKTPYMGEIDGTDLYIPYDQITSRAAEFPADHSARILVYCRSGNESRTAAQALLDLGYSNVWNLDKGMQSWLASGRALVQRPRT